MLKAGTFEMVTISTMFSSTCFLYIIFYSCISCMAFRPFCIKRKKNEKLVTAKMLHYKI